jgi:hypothetical protein
MREDLEIFEGGSEHQIHCLDLELVAEDSGPQSKKAFPGEWEVGALEDASESLVEHIFHVLVGAFVFRARSWRMLHDSFVGSKRGHRH